MRSAYHALILHAHLPFVRHPEHEDFLEEDWLYEAIFESYLPLLKMLRQLQADGVPAALTFTMTPSLCAMLNDDLLRRRAVRYLQRGREFCRQQETLVPEAQRELVAFYGERYAEALQFYEKELGCDIVGAFAQLQEEGMVEIITCAATHGFLPLMQNVPQAVRAQILIGRDSYRECFGRDPLGIWLPECAYAAGLDAVLAEAEIRWFVVDAHGVVLGQPRPRFAIFTPYFTPAGPACFGRDRDSSRQVWSSREGYPGDPAYRDFYRDLGLEVPMEQVEAAYGAGAHRRYTGVKPYRITGATPHKELYRRDWAWGAVDAHATDFLHSRTAQLGELAAKMPVDPILVSPFDAELFGHWWFEGPEFLNLYLRKAAYDQQVFTLTTPGRYLVEHPTQQILAPSASSWGNKGYWEVWLNEENAWIYPHLHAAARRMHNMAQNHLQTRRKLTKRLLAQMARELLLAQSSDWAFLMKTGTAKSYAERRTKDHLLRFNSLHQMLEEGTCDEEELRRMEETDNIFPHVQWQYYA
jgi:1,4-alpha-glucan branching enzyme